jgi:predicted negative regulator of RcsB-dependent stress response
MGKHRKQKGETKKARSRQNVRMLVSITSILILILAGWLWYESTQEDTDLSVIGLGENVIVQVHDPG